MNFKRFDFNLKWGGDWIVLLVSLLLAFIVWCLLKLSSDYSSLYQYRIELTTSLPGRAFNARAESAVIVKGTSTGFNILRQKYNIREGRNVLRLEVPAAMLTPVKNREDYFYVTTSRLYDKITQALISDIQVDGMSADTLFFNFPKTGFKRVPVRMVAKLSYKEQYMPFGDMTLQPDSVEIHGRQSIIEDIEYISTEPVERNNIKGDLQGIVRLVEQDGVSYSAKEVYYNMRGGRYFENSITVPVEVTGVPEGIKVILTPAEVTLTFREEWSKKLEYSAEDFKVCADYQQIIEASSGKAKVNCLSAPSGIYNIRITPAFTDRIILALAEQ